ncbi:MAG: hypothetical protein WBE29_22960 [Pseudolabrys sp.]
MEQISWLIVCCRLLRFEFFHRGVEIVVRAADSFDMTAVAERTAAVQASLFDDFAHVIDELGPAIPTRLNVAGGTDVVVGTRDMRAVRRPALGHVGRHLVAALFQKREELLKLAGVGGMRRDFEPIGVFTVTIKLLPLASTAWCGLRSDVRLESM